MDKSEKARLKEKLTHYESLCDVMDEISRKYEGQGFTIKSNLSDIQEILDLSAKLCTSHDEDESQEISNAIYEILS